MKRRVAPKDRFDNAPLFESVVRLAEKVNADTYRARVAEHFKAHPLEWINGLDLAKIGGAYAWRSRVSDVRRQLGMVIDNRQRKLDNGVTVSEYRWVP